MLTDVRVNVSLSKVSEVPVGLDRRELRVVRVIGAVGRVVERLRNHLTEREDVDLVRLFLALVPGQCDERPVVVEVGVFEERNEPELQPRDTVLRGSGKSSSRKAGRRRRTSTPVSWALFRLLGVIQV